jgi:hypothetical protein
MDGQRVEKIKERLGIVAPESYARFLRSRPGDTEYTTWEAKRGPLSATLYGGVDAVIVHNLQQRSYYEEDSGEGWPGHWLAIGDDGCGNIYYLDTEEGLEPHVRLWSHDPPDEIEDVAPSFGKFLGKMSEVSDPETEGGEGTPGGGLRVARTSPAWKSVIEPIGLEEWTAYVRSDPMMTFLGPREGRNPFTCERMVLKSQPGEAIWKQSPDQQVRLSYVHGRVEMRGSGPAHVAKMKEIARALKAWLFDPEGKEIPVL